MHSSSLLCSSNSLSPSFSIFAPQKIPTPPRNSSPVSNSPCFYRVPFKCSTICPSSLSPLHSTATEEIVETSRGESQFVEIGYISRVHGLEGEVRVKPNTDFPELRFSEPGRRWLRQQHLGRDKVQEVELVEGRGQPGQKSWIVKFSNVDKVDQAQQLVGSTILVPEEDRPELEEGEFYAHDLVGMRVILKETGEPLGTVVNVFDSGGSDLLHVMLNSSLKMPAGTGKPKPETTPSARLIWVPFVEAIVPNVDMNKREMLITPPKGLLELNLRSDERPKKERRQLEWKERKRFQKRLIAAKKKLCEMEQKHVFHGFRHGEKAQGSLLADQIVRVNSKLLQVALQNIKISSKRWTLSEFLTSSFTEQMSTYKKSEGRLITGGGEELHGSSKVLERGRLLTSKGKVATVLVVDGTKNQDTSLADSETEDTSCIRLLTLLSDADGLVKIEDRQSMPLIVVCPASAVDSFENMFSNNEHFAFDPKKVWFLEEEKLPVVSSSVGENAKHNILMKSSWEILQTPIGSGGVISLLSSNNILENLEETGVEYIEVCSLNQNSVGLGGKSLLGLVDSSEANIGIKIFKDIVNFFEEDYYHMIFSMKFMKQLIKQMNVLHFDAISKPNPHVEKVDKEWVDITPSSANSVEFRCSIYSSLQACPSDKVCVMEVTD